MTVFEFVLALTSVISGLAIAHMLTGVIALLRRATQVKFSIVHALWMWSAFATTIGNWAADWELRSVSEYPAWLLLMMILSKIAQYTFCVFVTPDIPASGAIDLTAFHQNERRGYLSAVIGFCTIAILLNLCLAQTTDYAQWFRDSILAFLGIAVTLGAFLVSARWVQLAAAGAFAALATYFLLAVSTLGGA